MHPVDVEEGFLALIQHYFWYSVRRCEKMVVELEWKNVQIKTEVSEDSDGYVVTLHVTSGLVRSV
jgi:hypothetical protein